MATALVRQGMTRSHAIQVAVNTIKKACSTGLWGGQKRKISPAIQAAACAAAAQWEAMKTSTAIESDERLAIELASRIDARLEMAEKKISKAEREKAPTAYGTSFPIRNKDELRRAIAAYGRAPKEKRAVVKRFIIRRARALDATSMLPKTWEMASTNRGVMEMGRPYPGQRYRHGWIPIAGGGAISKEEAAKIMHGPSGKPKPRKAAKKKATGKPRNLGEKVALLKMQIDNIKPGERRVLDRENGITAERKPDGGFRVSDGDRTLEATTAAQAASHALNLAVQRRRPKRAA